MSKIETEVMLNPDASYNDLNGSAKLAWGINEHTALEKIAQENDIDTEKFEVIGLSIYLSKSGFRLSFYRANKDKNALGKQMVKKISTDITLDKFMSYVKDFNIKLFLPHKNHDGNYEYHGEE